MAGPVIPQPPRMQIGGGGGGGGVPPYNPQQTPVPGTPLPVSPSIPPGIVSPAATPEEQSQRTSGWDQFLQTLSNPGVAQSLFQFGTSFGGDRAPGQSVQDKLMESLRGTVGSYNALQGQRRQEALVNQENQRKNAQLDILQGEQKVREGGLGVQQAKQKEQERSDIAQEKLEKEKIDSLDRYYQQQARQSAASKPEGMPPQYALQAATDMTMQQLQNMYKQRDIFDHGSPEFKAWDEKIKDLENNLAKITNQRFQLFKNGATGGQTSAEAAGPQFTPGEMQRIWEGNFPGDRVKLQQLYDYKGPPSAAPLPAGFKGGTMPQ